MIGDEIIEEEEKEISDENDKEEKIDDLSISHKTEESDIEENIKKSNEEQKQIEKDIIHQDMLDEKQHLIDIFDDLKDNIQQNEEESLEEIYMDILKTQEKKNKKIKKDISGLLICFMYYFIAPLFSIFNLMGVFQIISIMKVVSLIFKNVIKFFYQYHFTDKTDEFIYDKQINFKKIFYKNSYNAIVDFNLVMISGFIGTLILKSTGFYITSIIFLVINSIGIVIIFSSDFLNNEKVFENEKGEIIPNFTIAQVLILLFCLIILFIGAGGSALLSQIILNDRFFKLKTYLFKIKLKKIELFAYRLRKNFKKKEFEINNSNNASIKNNIIEERNDNQSNSENILYDEYEEKIMKSEIDENDKQFKKYDEENKSKFDNYFIICFTTILGYFLKYIINIILINYKDYSKFFYYAIGLYGLSIIISLFFYFLFDCTFEEEENLENSNKKNEYTICQICGYSIYTQKIFNNKEKEKCEFCKLLCKTIKLCCDSTFCVICNNICNALNFSDSCDNDCRERCDCSYCCDCCDCCDCFDCCFICCNYYCDCSNEQKCECCCCCCLDLDEINYEQNNKYFCYCYQNKRKFKWCNNYISSEIQKKIFPYLIEYFFLQLMTIAFENQYKINNNNNEGNKYDLKELLIFVAMFIITFIIFIYFTISFSNCTEGNFSDADDLADKIQEISNNILTGLHGILILVGFYSIIFSPYNFFNKDIVKLLNNNYYIYPPILLNKFFYFTLNYYYISICDDNKNLELLSGTLIITLYLAIGNFIISCISDYTPINIYLIQIIPSYVPSALFCLFIIVYFFYSIIYCKIPLFLFQIISFILCFGGLWSLRIDEEDSCQCKCECTKGICLYKCCDFYSNQCECCCNDCDCECECGKNFSSFLRYILCLKCARENYDDSNFDFIHDIDE